MENTTRALRAQGRDARQRLEQAFRPSGRMNTGAGPEDLVSIVEASALAVALELVEQATRMPDGLRGRTAQGWTAGRHAALTALRQALECRAAQLPPPAARPAAQNLPAVPQTWTPGSGLDWSLDPASRPSPTSTARTESQAPGRGQDRTADVVMLDVDPVRPAPGLPDPPADLLRHRDRPMKAP
ncbi:MULTISPECIES: hypothetical protein [unclassified Streptomyces]|uniref:hypothetical protein n=1 Tax=unclassified Streptomyces TaxID=2593676 RepID=UPI00344CFF78